MSGKTKISFFSFLILPVLISSASLAQDNPNSSWPSKVRLFAGGASHGRGIYYIDYLIPLYYSQDQNNLLFFNPKEHLSGPFEEETNLGVGFRRIFNDKLILGVNYFHDKSYSTSKKWYDQNGWGVELLSKALDLRLNYYKPITKPKVVDRSYEFGSTHLIQVDSMEEPLEGFDFELGGPVLERYTKTRAYVGGFFYNSRLSKDVRGLRVRTETNLNNWLSIDATLNRKDNGRLDFVGGLRFTLPFEWGRVRSGANSLKTTPLNSYIKDRLFERVVRDLDIQSSSSTRKQDDHNVEMIYVDNSNHTGTEDGSYSHPYTTLNNALLDSRYIGKGGTAKYVYIFKGDGVYNDSCNLADNAILWGSGYDGGFKGIPVRGYPIINGGEIDLGNNNTVMGLEMQNGHVAIYGRNVSNVVITHNNISNYEDQGIEIDITEGTVSNLVISHNNFLFVGNNAIIIFYDSVSSGLVISQNTFSTSNGYAGIQLSGLGTISDVAISQNTFNNFWYGIYIDNEGGASDVAISHNTCNNNSHDGISLNNSDNIVQGTMSDITISHNTCNNNGHDGIFLQNISMGALSDFIFSDNIVTGNAESGIHIASNGGLTATLSGNEANYNGLDGLNLWANGSINVSLNGNIFSNNLNSGIVLSSVGDTNNSSVDLGGGSLGSSGHNSIYSNGEYDVDNEVPDFTISAQRNWWGTFSPASSQFSGSVDYSHWLTSNRH